MPQAQSQPVSIYDGLAGAGAHIRLAVSSTGALSGKLALGGRSYPLAGVFTSGTTSIRIHARFAPLTVSMSLDSAAAAVTGTLSGLLVGTQPFSAALAPYSNAKPAPEAGQYTFLVSPTRQGAAGQGNGCGTMQVSPSGIVAIAGRTEGGAPFTASSYVNGAGAFSMLANTGAPSQSTLSGEAQFRQQAGISDLDGTFYWFSVNPLAGGAVTFIGSKYTVPAQGGLVLPFPPGQNNSALGFGNGSSLAATVPVTLSDLQLSSTSALLSHLSLNLETGAYSGKLSLSGSGGNFYGVAFQAQSLGAGVLPGKGGADWVMLTAPGVSGTLSIGGTNSNTTNGGDGSGSGSSVSTGASGGTLTIGGGLNGSGGLTLTGSNTYSGSTTINGGTLTVVGGLSGAGIATLSGSGNLTLAGSNTYSGSTTINGGTLQLGSGGATIIAGTPGGGIITTGTAVLGALGSGGNLLVADGGALTLTGPAGNLGATALSLTGFDALSATTSMEVISVTGTGSSYTDTDGNPLTLSNGMLEIESNNPGDFALIGVTSDTPASPVLILSGSDYQVAPVLSGTLTPPAIVSALQADAAAATDANTVSFLNQLIGVFTAVSGTASSQ